MPSDPPAHLETERLLLRPLTTADASALGEIYRQGDVATYLGVPAWTDDIVGAQVDRLSSEWSTHGYGQSAVELDRATGTFIGRVGLHHWDIWDEIELGYVIASGHQRLGYAREAATAWLDWADAHLDVDHLTTVIHPENVASLSLAASLGFTPLRRDVTPTGVAVQILARPRPN